MEVITLLMRTVSVIARIRILIKTKNEDKNNNSREYSG